MQFDLDQRCASLSVGEFADFVLGPRESSGGPSGLWRAQLGTHWHRQLQDRTIKEEPSAQFEVPIQGRIFHRGWTLSLTGRIDQMLLRKDRRVLREIKTLLRTLPCDESELRAEYPAYFLQLSCYASLLKIESLSNAASPKGLPLSSELVFVEVDSGLSQTVVLGIGDDALFQSQLERVTSFLDQRWQARERLRQLSFRPPFSTFRPGQENAYHSLQSTLRSSHSAILFEAPTGFGKTGIMLEAALEQMREGHFERLVYLTSKATGQLQVMSTLTAMCAGAAKNDAPAVTAKPEQMPLSIWLVRPKSEHCINHSFHCVRDVCAHIRDVETRWERSGLSYFTIDPNSPRDIASLRAAGAEASICPYEITRAALPFADVWIGDINYVFSPSARGLFMEQLAFSPARSLLIVDEAHNLPARVADAYSHRLAYEESLELLDSLRQIRAPQSLLQQLSHLAHFLQHLPKHSALPLDTEDDARHLLDQASQHIFSTPLDYAALGPRAAELLWNIPALVEEMRNQPTLQRHWWSPQAGTLSITCTDAAPAIGEALREFGGVLLSSATFGPHDTFAEAIGLSDPAPELEASSLRKIALQAKSSQEHDEALDGFLPAPLVPSKLGSLTKRETLKLFSKITRGSELLRVEEARSAAAITGVIAGAPWREGAYDVAVDLRVDTTFQHRDHHFATTASTLSSWHTLAGDSQRLCAVFFPSYAYAESILSEVEALGYSLRVAMQPRRADLAQQSEWVESSLRNSDVLFLVLGSSFAEGIDILGGRVARAMVVGPALPEVNPIQHARMTALARLGREASFRRVYQIPGMQKVNQALGRLVRAPGQTARVLLHCRRFADPGYSSLLSPDYQGGRIISNDAELSDWMTKDANPS